MPRRMLRIRYMPLHPLLLQRSLCVRSRIRIRCTSGSHGNKSSCLHNPVKRRSIYNKIFDNREWICAPWFDSNCLPVGEISHPHIAGRLLAPFTVRAAVDHHSAASANTFTAIMIECDRFLIFHHQLIIQHIQHFEK